MQDRIDEPFGAMLWRQRVYDSLPLCVMASALSMGIQSLAEIEMGWHPAPESEGLLQLIEWVYDFPDSESTRLRRKAEESWINGPCDLTEYLGIKLPFGPKTKIPVYRPPMKTEGERAAPIKAAPPEKRIVPQALETTIGQKMDKIFFRVKGEIPSSDDAALKEDFIRVYIDVVTEPFGRNNVIPREVIWQDGRHFSVDRVLSAMQSTVMLTGGVGTRYACEIRGKRRDLCFEQRNQWFVECRAN